MDLGFAGEVADFYASYRRGYPAAVFDDLVDTFGLTGEDTVLDLGCGTGQLTVPMAERVGHVLARGLSRKNVTWRVGSDVDLPDVTGLGAVTIGQALHLEHVIGGVCSALPSDRLPTKDRRPLFEERVRRSLEPHKPFPEHVRVSVLKGISSRKP